MADHLIAAQHYTFAGKGLSGVLDLSGITGRPAASLFVDGQKIDDPAVRRESTGTVIRGPVSATPDLETVEIEVTVPDVNLPADTGTFAGLAVLTTVRTSIGGPRLVRGVVQSYELRPIAGEARRAES